ncbi:MAG: PEP-CTERM sorting domain-containing protein [Phycisphaerae bacterium]
MIKRKNMIPALLAGVMLMGVVGSAQAAPLGFELELANPETSIFRLANTSESPTAEIVSVSMTIGDWDWNFDMVDNFQVLEDSGEALTSTLLVGDALQGNTRTDIFALQFDGFEQGDRLQWQTDLDLDTGDSASDFREVYFNNGFMPNSTMTINYVDGAQTGAICLVFPDDPADEQVFIYDGGGVPIPEPTTIAILMAGGLLAVARRRRRRN